MKTRFSTWIVRTLSLALALIIGFSVIPLEQAEATAIINIPLRITATDVTYPTTLEKGEKFSLQGTVSSSYGVITKINVVIKNRKTKATVVNTSNYPRKRTVELKRTINNQVAFGKLKVGSYSIKMTVYAEGHGKKTSKVILNRGFTVKDAKPKITINRPNYPPAVMYAGDHVAIRGVINTSKGRLTNVWAYVYDYDGNRIMYASYKPTKTYFDLHYTLNEDFPFDILPPGKYTFILVARAVNGKAVTKRTLTETGFRVK